jgi:hypothetical protein
LEALAVAGPAAKEIAGPVLEQLALQPSQVPHNRLEQSVEAVGGAPSMVPSLLARVGSQGVSIDDRAASLRVLAKSHDRLGPVERDSVRVAAETFLLAGRGRRPWTIR